MMPSSSPRSAHIDTFAFDHLPARADWPELIFKLPELQYPERLNSAVAFLETMCTQGFADKVAIRSISGSATESWTYAQLTQKVNQIAHVLVDDMKLVPGNRVLLRGANNPMMAACILAVFKVGCVAVPTMPLLRAKELNVIINKAQITAALCSCALAEELLLAQSMSNVLKQLKLFNSATPDSIDVLMQTKPPHFDAVDTSAEDVCLISFTSGTTGMPKGTMHFHRDILAICDCFPRSILQSASSDIFIGTPPLAFTFGLGGLLLFPLRIGATAVLLEKLTPEMLLKSIDEFQATVCFTAPTFYRQMQPLTKNFSLKSLQKTVSAGETLPAATRQAWQDATGLVMIDGIGATEMLHIFISAAGEAARPGATGKAIPGYEACVLDEQGNAAGPGIVGRLAVKGPTGCRYLADERQKIYVTNGWNLTGDAYEMDADGYFHYRARTDDMIITAGYNVAGPEVEEVLLQHPAVAECAVVACADEERGQIVKAFVVLRDANSVGVAGVGSDALIKELQDFVKKNLAPYKYPRAIEFTAALPRTETGKVQRFKLRQGA
jgi:2-aminobenzoate-CoA ligase